MVVGHDLRTIMIIIQLAGPDTLIVVGIIVRCVSYCQLF